MHTTLLLSPTLDASAQHARGLIDRSRRSDPLTPAFLLLPTTDALRHFRQMAGEQGAGNQEARGEVASAQTAGVVGLHYFQFYALAQAILDRAGSPVLQIGEPTIRALVRQTLSDMDADGELTTFAPMLDKPGFIQVLIDWLREVKTQGIPPEDATAHARTAGHERDLQLADFYTRYQRFLHERQLSDADGLLWLAAEALENDPDLMQKPGPFLAVGFDQFNPIQVRILRALAGRFTEMAIYLPWDAGRPAGSLPLARLAATRRTLEEALAPEIGLLENDLDNPSGLAHLRRAVFEPAAPKASAGTPPMVAAVAAPSREAEVRAALRAVKRRLLEGVPYHQIAILTPQVDAYRPVVRTVAAEYGLPIRLLERLADNPAIIAITNLLHLAPEFAWRETMDALRSPYVRQPWLTARQIDLLDQLTRERPVVAGREQWQFALRPLVLEDTYAEDQDIGPPPLVAQLPPEELHALEAGLMAFFDRLTPPASASPYLYSLWIQDTVLGLKPEEEPQDRPKDAPGERQAPISAGLSSRSRKEEDTRSRRDQQTSSRKEPDTSLRKEEEARSRKGEDTRSRRDQQTSSRKEPDTGSRRKEETGSPRELETASPRIPGVLIAGLLKADVLGLDPSQARPARDLQAIIKFLQCLRDLLQTTGLLSAADRPVSWEKFRADLASVLRAARLLSVPATEAAVRFGPLEVGRSMAVDELFVLGLAEGEFPGAPPPDPLYGPGERENHPLPLVRLRHADDASLWWQVIANCRRSLTLLRPRIDANGAPWLPSPYWQAVLELLDGVQVEEPSINAPLLIEAACSPGELLTALAQTGAGNVPDRLAGPWAGAQAAHEMSRRRASPLPAGIFEGRIQAPDLLAELAERFGPRHGWSVSRLNRYGSCPYGFFAQVVLGLEPRSDPAEGLEPLQHGSLLHALLERLGSRLAARGLSLIDTHLEGILSHLEAVCTEWFPQAPLRYGFRPGPLWEHEQAEIRRLLAALVRWECATNGAAARFQPYLQEARFGLPGGGLPHLELPAGDGTTIRLHGVIDRLDRDHAGNLRLIDYKSGASPLSKADIERGTALQTAIYALAAGGLTSEDARVAESAYLHIPSRKFGAKLEFEADPQADQHVRIGVENAVRFVHNVRAGAFPSAPVTPKKGATACSEFCQIAPLCRVSRTSIAKGRRADRRDT